MDINIAKKCSLSLINRSKIAFLGTIDENNYPNIKAMLKIKNIDLNKVIFSTNTSSRRIKQIKNNKNCCVYFVDEVTFEGLLLYGKINISAEINIKKEFWQDEFEKYYPEGVTDPDYSVLIFNIEYANYYHNLENINFKI